MSIRPVPHAQEAEQGVFSCLLALPDQFSRVADSLKAEDFFDDRHRILFVCMQSLYRRGKQCNMLTVKYELERTNKTEEAGGDNYLDDLFYSLAQLDSVTDHADVVKKTSVMRQLYQAAAHIADAAYHQEEDALEQAEQLIYQIALGAGSSSALTMEHLLVDYLSLLYQRRDNLANHVANGIPTRFPALDGILGALQPAELIILAARPSVGKSAIMLNVALNIVKHSSRALIFSLEMRASALTQRMIAMEAPIDQSFLRDGRVTSTQMQQIESVAESLRPCDLLVDDRTRLLSEIKSQARRLHAAKPLDLIVIDYLQLIRVVGESKQKFANRVEEVGQISRTLKELAMELNVPILALAQLNRAIESRGDKTPQLSDLRESGQIEQDADVVLFLHVMEEELERKKQAQPYDVQVIVGKNRNGPVAQITLEFRPRSTRFVDLSNDEDEEAYHA